MAGTITVVPRTERFALTANQMLQITVPHSAHRVTVKVTSDAAGATLVAGYAATDSQSDGIAVTAANAIALNATEWPWTHRFSWNPNGPVTGSSVYIGTSTGAGGYAFVQVE